MAIEGPYRRPVREEDRAGGGGGGHYACTSFDRSIFLWSGSACESSEREKRMMRWFRFGAKRGKEGPGAETAGPRHEVLMLAWLGHLCVRRC